MKNWKLSDKGQIAFKYINFTGEDLFLTGRAGTGKTTLLHHILNHTSKNVVVAAPTGVAAINAGGVTLHSLLHLPFGTFIPENRPFTGNQQVNTPQSVLSNLKMNSQKRDLLREMDLLIIDEVSMLRADLLDCADLVLRHIRSRRTVPFGGVQILYVGDLLQLPPVVTREEQPLISQYYGSPFFFDSQVIQQKKPLYLELTEVYRQRDRDFIALLDNLRDQRPLTADQMQLLQDRIASPEQLEKEKNGAIYLTTHNHKAEKINSQELSRLKGKSYRFPARIVNDFPEHLYPNAADLVLKKGAQVIFIKNDTSGDQQYFNGKIGKISDVGQDELKVMFPEENLEITVEPHKWENKTFRLDKETNEIEAITKGEYYQYPLKLAWAITVHKSQGLTFDRAILDLGESFAPGQMYVALSRLRTLDGLTLTEPLPQISKLAQGSIEAFAADQPTIEDLEGQFVQKKYAHQVDRSIDAYQLRNLYYSVQKIKEKISKESKIQSQQNQEWLQAVMAKISELQQTGDKFCRQLERLKHEEPKRDFLASRLEKAQSYFIPHLEELSVQVNENIKAISRQKKVKGYLKEVSKIEPLLFNSIVKMARVSSMTDGKSDIIEKLEANRSKRNQSTEKQKKKNTREISLDLYLEGKKLEEIAEIRNLVPGTIAGHLCHYIAEGKVQAEDLLPVEKLQNISKVIDTFKDQPSLTDVKSKLGDEYSYADIKIAQSHLEYQHAAQSE